MLFLIFLIAPPGNLRHSLAVLLTSLGADQQIEQFDIIHAAFAQQAAKPPDLIMCDLVALDDAVTGELAALRSRWPQAHLVVMSDAEEASVRLAGSAIVVNTGAAATRLRAILSDLLCDGRKNV